MRARAGLLSKDHWAPLGIVAPYVIVRERSDRGNPFSLADVDIPHVTEGERIATSGFETAVYDCHWHSIDFDSLRGAPLLAMTAESGNTI